MPVYIIDYMNKSTPTDGDTDGVTVAIAKRAILGGWVSSTISLMISSFFL